MARAATQCAGLTGWAEFDEKRTAKMVAHALNNEPMSTGASRKKHYSHELWSLKYLSGFKWSELTEKIGALAARAPARC